MSYHQSYLGLGYSHQHHNDQQQHQYDQHPEQQQQQQQQQHQKQQQKQEEHQKSGDSSNSNSIDALMSSYMSTCVDYHQQQLKLESSEASSSSSTSTLQVQSNINSPLHFLPSSSPSSEYHYETNQHQHQHQHHDISNNGTGTAAVNADSASTNTDTSASNINADNKEHNSQTNAKTNENENTVDQDKLQQAINKAKDIAHRFNSSINHTTCTTNTNAAAAGIPNTITSTAKQVQYPYAQKRHDFLTLHHQKLNQCYIHNLDYIAKRDEEKLQKQMHHLHSIQERHQQTVKQKQQQQQQQQQQNTLVRPCLAGIGSRQRKGYQNKKHDLSLSTSLPSCGVYISGLPTSGSNLDSTGTSNAKDDMGSCKIEIHSQLQSQELESMLSQLFGSYGRVISVKLYRVNARNTTTTGTGASNSTSDAALKSSHLNNSLPLKGDALIRYDWGLVRKERIGKGESDDVGEFLEMVCQQVSF